MPTQDSSANTIQHITKEAINKIQKIIDNEAFSSEKEEATFYHDNVMPALLFMMTELSTRLEKYNDTLVPDMLNNLTQLMDKKDKTQDAIEQMRQEDEAVKATLSSIDTSDPEAVMNYLGKRLMSSLREHLLEVPANLRDNEMLLRTLEVLLTNMLSNLFPNPRDILKQFSEHVDMALTHLPSQQTTSTH